MNCLRITIVTSTLNCAEQLRKTARSIRSQNFANIQWIIADGASSDGTVTVIKENSDIVSDWFSEADRGIYDAWNKACRFISGDWVLFLGAGDVLHDPDALNRFCASIRACPDDLLIAYGDVIYVNLQGEEIQRSGYIDVNKWGQGRPQLPAHQGVFHSRKLFVSASPFDVTYKIAADAKFVLAAVRSGKVFYFASPVAKMDVTGVSNNPASWSIMALENARVCSDLKIEKPLLIHRPGDIKMWVKRMLYSSLGQKSRKVANLCRSMTRRRPLY